LKLLLAQTEPEVLEEHVIPIFTAKELAKSESSRDEQKQASNLLPVSIVAQKMVLLVLGSSTVCQEI
jgi:hypothetical protein